MVYSLAERVEIVSLFYRNHENARETARLFNGLHPDRSVHHKYVLELLRKFQETGSVANAKRNPQREFPVMNEAASLEVVGQVSADPALSTRKLAGITNLSRTTIRRILKKFKFHPYKIKLVHELNEDDHDRRLEFCENMSQRIIDTRQFLFNICFSDESSFFLNGTVNRHNCRFWSDENPHVFHEVHTQTPQKVNVWAGIFGDQIIGPIFIDDNLTGERYLRILEDLVYPRLIDIVENDERYSEADLIFQHDGAPPHYAAAVREFLDANFPGQWIGRRGPVEWPARSPDLSPLDFFLWGHIKSKVYATECGSLEELRQRITLVCRGITPEMLGNVRQKFEQNLYNCMEVGGAQFEHLLD